MRPSVSVVVPVWNVEPYLRECLDSVVGQTIGLDRIELIAVDDGSTDGSGRILDEYAARYPQIRVMHTPNSGGPGGPRNVGLDESTSTYVFFLDADDYLGPEALERLVAMAERNGSDIVLGKLVAVAGRKVYRDTGVFRRSADRADMELVYRSGNVLKLFRRSMIERAGLRFHDGMARGEDGDFMARAYPEAATISVVADYDCYFVRRRPGSQTTRSDRHDDLVAYIARLETDRIMVVAAQRRPGVTRDIMMVRHIRQIASKFGGRWRALEPDERRRVFDAGAAVIRRWHTGLIQRALPRWAAVRVYCLQHGLFAELEDIAACPPGAPFRDPIVERGRIFARYPHFRDGSGIPDSCFDITNEVVPEQRLHRATLEDGRLELSGEAYLRLVGGATTVELHGWPRGATWRCEAAAVATPELRDGVVSYPYAGFEVTIDLSSAAGGRALPAGTWSIGLSVGIDGVRRTVRLRAPRRLAPVRGTIRAGDVIEPVTLYVTRAREMRLRMGRRRLATTWLEQAETVSIRGSRLLVRAMTSTRPGRLLALAIERLRPGIAARLFEE